MAARGTPLLSLAMTAVVAVPSVAFLVERLTGPAGSGMELTASTGAVAISNSDEGKTILTAPPMLPGSQSAGMVTMTNSGGDAETMTLDADPPADAPGPGGGALSDRLELRVEDLGADGSTTTVYAGAITALHQLALGTWATGEAHRYRFVVRFPDGGPGGADNAYQGSSTSIGFSWTAQDASSPAPEPDAGAPVVASGDAPVGGDAGPPADVQTPQASATGAPTPILIKGCPPKLKPVRVPKGHLTARQKARLRTAQRRHAKALAAAWRRCHRLQQAALERRVAQRARTTG